MFLDGMGSKSLGRGMYIYVYIYFCSGLLFARCIAFLL